MSNNGGKKKGRHWRFVGSVLALGGTLSLIVKAAGDLWSADEIARWVAGAIRTLSSSMAWQLSLGLAVFGVALIVVSQRAASVLTKWGGFSAVQTVRRTGVLAVIAGIAALVFGFVGSRSPTKRVTIANVPPPTPKGATPTLPGNPHQPPETPPTIPHTSTAHHESAQGSSQAPSEDVSYKPRSPAATAASAEPSTPTATDASYSEPAPQESEAPEESASSESSPERTSSTIINENTSTTVSTSSTSAESSASASSSVSVTGENGSESITDSSQSASTSGQSSASSSASVTVTESSETTES